MSTALIALASVAFGVVAGFLAAALLRKRDLSRLVDALAERDKEIADWSNRAEEQIKEAAAASTKAARIPELEQGLADARSEITRLTGVLAEAQTRLSSLTEVREALLNEFKVLAGETFKEQGQTFTQQNKDQIDTILSPLREKITEFQQEFQKVYVESAKERTSLSEQFKTLTVASAKMTEETENLTRALKGDVRMQGAWGEAKLELILERSGLRKGEDYVAQETHSNSDGNRLRPDVIVNLPGGKRLVIDSKVSLTSFERYVNAATDEERALHLKDHVASMQAHIGRLSDKEYWQIEGAGVDYVVMFVPIEGALAVALQLEPDLTALAVQKDVAISTPTTLMTALKTVASVWRVERQNRNAEAIADRAGKLYDKFVGFIDDMDALGGRLDAAKDCYAGAMAKLSTGSGNLVRQVELIKELGARTKKSLPQELIDDQPTEITHAPESDGAIGAESSSPTAGSS